MGQKSHPTILRRITEQYRGIPTWDTSVFNHNVYSVHKLIRACCKNSSLYADNILITLSHESIYIQCSLLQLFGESTRKRKSRRNSKNNKDSNQTTTKNGWNYIRTRLYFSLKLIQEYTGFKCVKLKITRKKIYTKNIPKTIRQKICFYTRGFNSLRFNYARTGMQLLTALVGGETTAECLNTFIRNNIRTRSKRKKHTDFTRFLKQGIDALEPRKKIKGIKIQMRGRFGHKPKGRSKIWKYQLGPMPLSKIKAKIQARFQQAQTKLGSVGIKTWVYLK